jgi:predicted ester cyclase
MASPDVVLRRWFEEVWNQRQESAIDELMASDAIAHGLGPQPIRGSGGFKPFFRAFSEAFPTLTVDVVRTIVDGDMVVTQIHCKGRHTGSGLGGGPTNRDVEVGGMVIARVRNGQIVEGWNCIDFLSMYQQMGWVTNPVAPA